MRADTLANIAPATQTLVTPKDVDQSQSGTTTRKPSKPLSGGACFAPFGHMAQV